MIDRKTVMDGWYGEALPSGHYAVTLPGHETVLTHTGRWDLRGDNLLFTRCSDAGGIFRVAGQSHFGHGNLLSTGSGFETIGASYGVSPVLFTPAGDVIQGAPQYGSQGFRYWDGRPVTGDETYVHPTFPQLWEYTTLGDITVGQGEVGAILYYQGIRRMLEDGHTTFIRFNRDGDRLAFAIVKPGYCQFIWMTVQDIEQLPRVGLVGPLPPPPPLPPIPDPPLPPEPEPIPVPNNVPNRGVELLAFWQEWNGSKNITDEAEKHRFTEAFMKRLNEKDGSGRWGRKSRTGNAPISKDTAGYWIGLQVPTEPTDGKIHAFDLITGSTGAVHWDTSAEQGNPDYYNIDARWYPVSAVPAPKPDPKPDPAPDTDVARLRAEVEAMNKAIAYNFDAMTIRFDQIVERVEAIEKRPVTTLPKLRVKGSTSQSVYHNHKIDLEVVPE